ncbi:SDR family oxidoreductase [Nocardioides sp. Soil805]|uniref:SDR family oxidoreductase n=1 Tax=Nocardioides sp. Soil805 TaxID=1736416 RepID=UPI000702DCDA|nr:SDR family NAD(P)-dependent oxidoreductase [Nocardioides sp. Soil805]KRF30686.1 short-chain dehydrogenase [Nocardioides sp. Soil805]
MGALVTGAGRGLGARIAALLAERGHVVHVTDVDPEAAAAVAERIGGGAFASALDVRDAEACDAAAAETVERTGSLDVWVNNAGVLITGPAWEQTPEQRRLMVEVNTLGVVNGTVSAIGAMRAQGRGHVVNVASLAGLVAVPGEGVYAGSKHAVLGFSLSTAADLRLAGLGGRGGIEISCVCPDGIWTPMLHDKLDDPGAALSFSGTLLSPDRVAEAVADVLDRPRPVTAVPRWRGVEARVVDAFPRLGQHGLALGVRLGRRTQRRLRRRGGPTSSC